MTQQYGPQNASFDDEDFTNASKSNTINTTMDEDYAKAPKAEGDKKKKSMGVCEQITNLWTKYDRAFMTLYLL